MNQVLLIVLLLLVKVDSQPEPVWTDNCLNVTSAGTCAQCADGFYLEYFTCLPCAPLCLCSSQYNYCESCISVTYQDTSYSQLSIPQPATNSCVLCDTLLPFCLECTYSTTCLKCYGGYYPTPSPTGISCSQTQCHPNCQICSNNQTCEYCMIGYFLDGQGKCNTKCLLKNCLVCNATDQCATCHPGYRNDPTLGCLPCIPNCLQCKDDIHCQQCAPGYFRNITGCAESGFPNCVLYYPNAIEASACQVCEPGYFVLFGSCNQCVGCELCSLQFLCQTPCLPGSTPFNYACLVPFIIGERWIEAGWLIGVLTILLLE